MARKAYTEEEIEKIIDACENLIVPDDTISLDEAERQPKLEIKIKTPKNVILTRYLNEQQINDSDEYFETFFQECKQKRHSKQAPQINDFSNILPLSDDGNSKKNPEDAIFINNMIRKRLGQFRKNIENTISKIDNRLKSLELFLEDAKSSDTKDPLSFKTTYSKCGAPFFKDALSYPAPENDDFKYRKNVLNEFFPFDLPQTNNKWRMKEKIQLVQGIKNQMISHIKLQQSKKVCQLSKTRGKLQKLRFISNNQDLNGMSISNIYETIQSEYPDFQINWNLISFNDLQSTHTLTECIGMWYGYLRPGINREDFTDEENALLSHLVIEHKYQNWELIAQQLDRRTSLQTFSHFASESARLCPPNVRWTPEEDELLLEAVRKSTSASVILWNKVGTSIPSRNKTQCYNRYLILNKNVNVKKGVFSAHENRILLNYVAKYGEDFSKMPPDLMPNRSIIQIKNHYNVALKHKGKVNPWTSEEDTKLMEFVEKEGTNNWKKISDILETHNRLSCRTRYLTISKFLSKNPNKSIKDVPSRLKTVTAVHKAIHNEKEEEEEREMNQEDEYVEENKIQNYGKSFGLLSFDEFKMKNQLIYNLMKTNYKYNLNYQEYDMNVQNFLILKSLLDIEHSGLQRKYAHAFTPSQYTKINQALAMNLNDGLEMEVIHLKLNAHFMVPLNYFNAVGLRSVAIKINEDQIDTTNRAITNPSTEIHDQALKKFQQLFMSLFYWPAMLSKIEYSELAHYKSLKNQSLNQVVKFINLTPISMSMIEKPMKRPSELKVYKREQKKQKIFVKQE